MAGNPSRSQSRATKNNNQESKWIESVKDKLGNVENKPPDFTIQRIPAKFRKVKKDAYSPRMVSIGPFHWGQTQLRGMDQCKWRYMKIILHRVQDAENCLANCGKQVEELNKDVRKEYAEEFNCKVGDNLNQIMLLDGLFILELFLRCWDKNFRYDNDPIISNAWLMPFLRHDLSLLENQIPLKVLETLYNIIKPLIIRPPNYSDKLPRSVTCLALHFFHGDFNQLVSQYTHFFGSDCKHLLHLLHKWYLSANVSVDIVALELSHVKGYGLLPVPTSNVSLGFHCCATELLAAGIEFRPGHSKKLLKIKFSKEKGELKIPKLCIHETTESLLRNLIAFEQCTSQVTHHITSYVALMRSLIHSPEDVKLLQSKEIIEYNNSGEAKDVVELFNSILKEVVPGKFHFVELIRDVNSYYQEWWRWHRIKAVCRVRFHENVRIFIDDYVPNPWRGIQLFVAAVLVILTATQTYYSVHS